MGERGLRGAAGAVQQNREIRGSLGNTEIQASADGPSGSQAYKMASFNYTGNCNGMFPISRIVMVYFQSVIFAMVWFQLNLK